MKDRMRAPKSKGRIRVTLSFDMLFDEEVLGITPELEQTSWFAPIGQSVELRRLGARSVTNVRRAIKVIKSRRRKANP